MDSDNVSHETKPSRDMIALRHVSEGWRITTDPDIFGGIIRVLLTHGGLVRVLTANGNMAEIDCQNMHVEQGYDAG